MIQTHDRTSTRAPRFGATWAVLVLFVVLTLVLTWPVVVQLGTRVPGTATWAFDESTFVWNIWYFKHSLIDLHVSPLHSELIWHPLGIDLILFTYNFFNAIVGLPVLLVSSAAVASNVTVLLAAVLSALGAYLLAFYVLSRVFAGAELGRLRAAAVLAGVIYAFASNRAVYAALGHYDMVTTQWLPLYALYLLKTLHRPRLKHAFMAGLFFALASLAEMIFASFLALLSLVILLASWGSLRQRGRAVLHLGLAAVIAAVIWSPVLVPIAREFTRADYALEGWGESLKLSADLAGLVTPTALNPVLPGDGDVMVDGAMAAQLGEREAGWRAALRAVETGNGRFSDINTVFLGWVTLALAVAGAVLARRKAAAWTWTALVFGVLVLGPLLQINGRFRYALDGLLPEGVTFPLPFTLLHFIPFVSGNRAPNRNSVILMLALAVLAAYAVAWLLNRYYKGRKEERDPASPLARRPVSVSSVFPVAAVAVLSALVIVEHLSVPLPTTGARIPAIYEQIGREEGDFAIMQLPLGWRDSFGVLGSEQTNLQYFQTAHGKRMMGGNISRAPEFKMEYFARIPLFKAITELEMYREVAPEVDGAARAQAGALMALYDVRYLVTTPAIPGRYPYQDTKARTEAFALDVLPLEKPAFWEADGYAAYRVVQPPVTLPFQVDLGTAGVEPYSGQGWDLAQGEQPYNATAGWVTGRSAEVYLPLDAPRDVTLRVAIAPLTYDGADAQTVSFIVNGETVLRDQVLQPGWQTVEARVPGPATRRGPNRLTLRFAWAKSPREAFPDPASRAVIGATGVVSPLNLEAHGFSEAFMSTFDAQGAKVDVSTGRRGYNVAVLDERTGRLLDQRGFDTAANGFESDRLAEYLVRIREGRIVMIATKEDAHANLTAAAVEALRGVGSRVASADELGGQSHALIGIKGAAPGTAAETIAPDAYVRAWGDFRTLAAAVDWVELSE
jgi:hypothetical protein